MAAASLSASAGTAVGMADVWRLQRAAARLHGLDQQHGGDTLWQAALAEARDGVQLLEYGSYTGTVGRQLLSATGRLQICAGWLAFDAGQHEVVRSCFGEACELMNTSPDELIIHRHDGQGLREQKDELLAVYQEAYAEWIKDSFFIQPASGNGWNGVAHARAFGW